MTEGFPSLSRVDDDIYILQHTKVYHHLKNPVKVPVMCQFSPGAIRRKGHESGDNSQISNVER